MFALWGWGTVNVPHIEPRTIWQASRINLYRLEGFAKDSETLEEMVVYRALYGDGGRWVRSAKMFFETVERDGKTMKRFELLVIMKLEATDEKSKIGYQPIENSVLA